jgi:diguanylate cyclase (GGDEF)-like protein
MGNQVAGSGRAGGWASFRGFTALAWIVLIGGVITSLTAGTLWAHVVQQRQETAFDATVRSVDSVVATELERQSVLLGAVQGLVDSDPEMTNGQFLAWYEGARIAERFPGGIGVNYLERVPAEHLAEFAARQEADPATGLPSSSFELFPNLAAPEYCLQRLGVWEIVEVADFQVPAGLDYCATSIAGYEDSITLPASLHRAASTGSVEVLAPEVTRSQAMALIAPIYRAGAPTETAAEREAASIGWVTASFDANLLVAGALDATPDTRVEVSWASPDGWVPIATGGTAPDDAWTSSELVGDGQWRVAVTNHAAIGEVRPQVQGALLALGGIAMSVLLFALFRMLAGSRERALDLVDEKTEQLEYQALHDILTGLPNRALLLDRIEHAIARQERDPSGVAVLFVDLDNFKSINDTLGHAAGDEYLKAVAGRLTAALRSSDTVGRLGGDEFVVLVEEPGLLGGPELVAQRIMDVFAEPIHVSGVATPVSCSIGIALSRGEGAESLLQDADVAMYRAKADGRKRYVMFEPDMADSLSDRINLEWDLGSALEDGELSLVYQPTFDLRTDETTGVEALLRWHHPDKGLIGPNDFIPIAEESGLIIPIGRWVLDTACAQAAEWTRQGHPVRMAVNVSAVQLDDESLVDDVRRALATSGLSPHQLTLEITETALMRDALAIKVRLHELKILGVSLAIDDFGTGYSSLAYLQQFPVDAIKIDRSFISGIAESRESHALIRTLIQLGKTLQLETLAEGIEDKGQLHELLRQDCDTGQGFLYARPMPADAVTAFMEQRRSSDPSVAAAASAAASLAADASGEPAPSTERSGVEHG